MTEYAKGTFTIDGWDQETFDEAEGATLARAQVTKTFTGDLSGASSTTILTCTTPVETSAAYVGFERFSGTVGGRAGTFVLHHSATAEAEAGQTLLWAIVPDSGTGELRTIRGAGQIVVDADGGHTYTLEYTL
ncbi:DUF3224 domain-containing protein [Phytohabitans kaempferiae]|uniref:DUF3224 domain-containing protein n=1 Tax=Phytohabitans kaempferiae TaxID=1620943 RepID=A0ABV6M150_9ACTN